MNNFITENQLIHQAIMGDLDSFNELVLRYQDTIYNHTFTLLGDHAAADDATQECFIKAFQGISGFRGGSFRRWLLQIATHASYDLFRRVKRHPTLPLFPEDENGDEVESPVWMADPHPSPHLAVEADEFSNHIYKLINELPSAYRNALALVDIQELEYSEAADVLDIPIGTLKSRLARARHQMKTKLQEDNVDFFIRCKQTVPRMTPQYECR